GYDGAGQLADARRAEHDPDLGDLAGSVGAHGHGLDAEHRQAAASFGELDLAEPGGVRGSAGDAAEAAHVRGLFGLVLRVGIRGAHRHGITLPRIVVSATTHHVSDVMSRGVLDGSPYRNRRRRRLFSTTNTELKAIAAPASIGASRPRAASGIAATLYAKAQNRFVRMTPSVLRERRTASPATRRSLRTSVTSLASVATSVPVPMAIPRSACAGAAASLTPSPTIATLRPSCWRDFTTSTFSAGSTPAMTRSMPTVFA